MIDTSNQTLYIGEPVRGSPLFLSDALYANIGVDPSLRHGSAVYSEIISYGRMGLVLHRLELVAIWGKSNGQPKQFHGVGIHDEMPTYVEFGRALGKAIARRMDVAPSMNSFIDWVPGSALSNVRMASILAFAMGATLSSTVSYYPQCKFVHPSTLRSSLGLKPRDDKSRVHACFKAHFMNDLKGLSFMESLSEDSMDALILSAYPRWMKQT